MALSQTTHVERVTIVLAPDGTLKGAHQESLSIVKDGDAVVSALQEPPVPLDAATLATILPGAQLAAQSQALIAELAATKDLLTAAGTALEAAKADIAARDATIKARDDAIAAAEARAIAAEQRPADSASQLVDAPQAGALDFLAFLALFTSAEQAAIVSSSDPAVRLFMLMTSGAYAGVVLTDARVVAGLDHLVAAGILTAERRAQIGAGKLPA